MFHLLVGQLGLSIGEDISEAIETAIATLFLGLTVAVVLVTIAIAWAASLMRRPVAQGEKWLFAAYCSAIVACAWGAAAWL